MSIFLGCSPAVPEGMSTQDAAWNEGMATFLLLTAVFVLCTTRDLIQLPLVAVFFRVMSIYFGATGNASILFFFCPRCV